MNSIRFKWDYYSPEGPFNEDLWGVFKVTGFLAEPTTSIYLKNPREMLTISVELVHLEFGGAKIDRDTACKMYGEQEVFKVEQHIAELEQYE